MCKALSYSHRFLSAGPSLGLGSPLGRSRHSSSQSDLSGPSTNSSGLSFTACMSDFSLYVFHPYGAGKQKSAVTGLPPGPGPLGMNQIHPVKLCYTVVVWTSYIALFLFYCACLSCDGGECLCFRSRRGREHLCNGQERLPLN